MANDDRPDAARVPAAERPIFTTETLFGASTEIEIVHDGTAYRLRITRQGKLILNK